MRTVLVLGFWCLVWLAARLLWRFAKRPVAPAAHTFGIVRAADSLTRDAALLVSAALWALVGCMGVWSLIVLAAVSAD